MNQKKCPKCGENNPAEAVMCWACYTPLTGAAAATASGTVAGGTVAGGPRGAPGTEEEKKKSIEPWQLGVVGAGALIGLIALVMTFRGGSSSDPTALTTPTGSPVVINMNPPAVIPPAPPGGPTSYTETGGGSVPAQPADNQLPYTLVAPPNPQLDIAVVGIVPTQRGLDPNRAASVAKTVRSQLVNGSGYKIMHIYVFADEKTGQEFSEFQASHQSLPLDTGGYTSLAPIWPKTLCRYEYYKNGAEKVRFPGKNPRWWQ